MMIAAVIQARMGSMRLPGKALMDICGRSMLGRVIDRVKYAEKVNLLVVATTDRLEDDVIEQFCINEGLNCFRGNSEDVLDRYYKVAKYYGLENIVRVTADCPLIDPDVIDRVISEYDSKNINGKYASNCQYKRTYPRGMDVEVFDLQMLTKAYNNANSKLEREHVTPYMKLQDDSSCIIPVYAERDYSKYRLTVDTNEDMTLIRKIFEGFGNSKFSYLDVIELLECNPTWENINKEIEQKDVNLLP